jgi:hypothetical protein
MVTFTVCLRSWPQVKDMRRRRLGMLWIKTKWDKDGIVRDTSGKHSNGDTQCMSIGLQKRKSKRRKLETECKGNLGCETLEASVVMETISS